MIRHGLPPFLECSTKGDKRFSAFCARIEARGGRSIESMYQAYKSYADTGSPLGRVVINYEDAQRFYAQLWDEYIAENPELLYVLKDATGLSDMFGKPGHACQATELWRIRCASLLT